MSAADELRESLTRERDVLQARLRYIEMTLEGLDGLDATNGTHVPSNAAQGPTDAPGALGKLKARRGLSVKLAREAILESERPLTPERLAEEMLRRGWQTPAANPVAAARAAGNRVREAIPDQIGFANGKFRRLEPKSDGPATRPQFAMGGES